MRRGRFFVIIFILVLLSLLLTLLTNILLYVNSDQFESFIAEHNIIIVLLTFLTVPASLISLIGIWQLKKWGVVVFASALIVSIMLEVYFNLTIEYYYLVYTPVRILQYIYYTGIQLVLIFATYRKMRQVNPDYY